MELHGYEYRCLPPLSSPSCQFSPVFMEITPSPTSPGCTLRWLLCLFLSLLDNKQSSRYFLVITWFRIRRKCWIAANWLNFQVKASALSALWPPSGWMPAVRKGGSLCSAPLFLCLVLLSTCSLGFFWLLWVAFVSLWVRDGKPVKKPFFFFFPESVLQLGVLISSWKHQLSFLWCF